MIRMRNVAEKEIKDRKKLEEAKQSLTDLQRVLEQFAVKPEIIDTSTEGRWQLASSLNSFFVGEQLSKT